MVSFSTAVALSLLVGCHGIALEQANSKWALSRAMSEALSHSKTETDEHKAQRMQLEKKMLAFGSRQNTMQALEALPQFWGDFMWMGNFSCNDWPQFCQAPFNCGENKLDTETWAKKGIGFTGHANFKTWCAAPHYGHFMEQCIVKKDLIQAARTQYQLLTSGVTPSINVIEQEASYCFVQGHCKDTEVTAQTTLEEAEALCDKKIGHSAWTLWGSRNTEIATGDIPNDKAYTDPQQTLSLLAGSCATGSYHCDVMMCKETFCKEPQWIEKYGKYSAATVLVKEDGLADSP